MVKRTFTLNIDFNEDVAVNGLWAVVGEEGSTQLNIIPAVEAVELPLDYAVSLKCLRKDGLEEVVSVTNGVVDVPDTMYAKAGDVRMLIIATSVDNTLKSAPFTFKILDEI